MEKYYTPNVEDIHIGYECEIKPKGSEEFDWMKYVINGNNNFDRYFRDSIRTPYLTKEQIETEGFIDTGGISPFFGQHTMFYKEIEPDSNFKDDFARRYTVSLEQGKIRIEEALFGGFTGTHESYSQIYYGKCPSINEFRKICKLLGIN